MRQHVSLFPAAIAKREPSAPGRRMDTSGIQYCIAILLFASIAHTAVCAILAFGKYCTYHAILQY